MSNSIDDFKWYHSYFPEELFPIDKKLVKNHMLLTISGKKIARESDILIVGCCRNVEKALTKNIARIETLGNYFRSYKTLFYENDSEDNTTNILFEWAKNNSNINIISEKLGLPKNKQDTSLERAEAMANARNKYLIEIKKIYHKYNFIIVYDLDILGGFSYRGIFNSLGHLIHSNNYGTIWDFVGSNGVLFKDNKKLFYDWWAYLDLEERTNRPPQEINVLDFKNGDKIKEVNSCFGGLGIYKSKCFKENIWYTNKMCDHATLNLQLHDLGYNIVLNPSQIVCYNEWN